MGKTFPGMTVETSEISRGSSKVLFDGIFAAGGITLSQVCIMTGLEPYLVQNWVKRGFVSSPIKRVYSRSQFARIVIINMLRDTLQIDVVSSLIHIIGGDPKNVDDDLISDDELYHRYVDMLSDPNINIFDEKSVESAAKNVTADFQSNLPNAAQKLSRILQAMHYAHSASLLKEYSNNMLSTLDYRGGV